MTLARNIAVRNPEITVEELNYAVQQTIDRIIFLRMAEDRGIEPYGQLLKLLDKENIYKSFAKLCKKADDKYNSGLFHFKEEKNIDLAPDNLTLGLAIDDGIFKTIIRNLYYPKSPYEFSVLAPEILGNVYEQFLGKVIRLTDGHRAKIEEKTEVKKAGGVFYTPQYIVDYIVKNTVGKLLEGKTPNQVSKLRIVDPACGSGSFLLGAYTYLLNWHRDYYTKLDKPPKNTIYEGKNKEYHLTIQKKKEILLNNIYGVDIDTQAVEVTKLSLLLKVLEDENKDALEQQQKLFQERVLPFLGENIKCGNSLIATDILDDETLTNDEIAKINPFDWEEEFPAIFQDGGFDVAIGNPPYGAKLSKNEQNYLKKKYFKSSETAIAFTKLAHYLLLKDKGYLGYIIPKSFTFASNYKSIREYILEDLSEIIDCKKVWKKVKLEQIMLFFRKNFLKEHYISGILKNKEIYIKEDISKDTYTTFEMFLNDVSNKELDIALKIRKSNIFVKDIANNSRGGIFQKNISDEGNTLVLGGAEIQRKGIIGIKGKIDFDLIKDDKKVIINENSILVQRIIAHLTKPRDHIKITACYPENRNYVIVDTINQITFNKEYNCKIFWALFNSKLINWYCYRFIFAKAIRTMQFDNPVTNRIPIFTEIHKNQHSLLKTVDKMFLLYHDINNAKTPHKKKLLEKQIKATDKKIDQMVYELYGLTEEEITIVENN